MLARIGLFAGPLVALLVYGIIPAEALGAPGRATAAIGTWMAVWWLTEAIPIAATSLLPLAAFPLFGARSITEAATPYGSPLLFLFLGGFLLALTMERWGLHRRIALSTLALAGTRPRNIVGAFMALTAFLSMWTSNTATTVMMLPIALSVIDLVARAQGEPGPNDGGGLPERERAFSLCLLLGIAYAASIGGVGTIVGTAPNLFLVSFARENLGREIGFAEWLIVGVPAVVVLLPLTWLLLTRVLYPVRLSALPGGRELLREAREGLGPWKRAEKITLVVFTLTALAWLFRPLLESIRVGEWAPLSGLTDTSIAIAAGILLFALPAGGGERVLNWPTARRLPWGILLLFGGGLSLAAALDETGVTALLGAQVTGLEGAPPLLIIAVVTALVVFLTEATSNTATTAAFVPLLAGIAHGLGLDPLALAVPAALAASCAFMLPVATPPNAIVFGAGQVTIGEMARAGLWLNLISVGAITLLTWTIVIRVFGAE